jgi:hypothetical protein
LFEIRRSHEYPPDSNTTFRVEKVQLYEKYESADSLALGSRNLGFMKQTEHNGDLENSILPSISSAAEYGL